MYPQKQTISLTSAVGGAASGYSTVITGRILSVHYVPDVSVPFTGTPNFSVKTEDSGQNVWVQSGVTPSARLDMAPRQATHSTAGVAALYAGSGTAVNDFVYAAHERVTFSVTGAGDAKKATFILVYG